MIRRLSLLKRLPLLPTLIVLIAIGAMLRLGFWQLDRALWKDALLARYAANARRAPLPYPDRLPLADAGYYRQSAVICAPPILWQAEAGQTASGQSGWRHIARCAPTTHQVPVIVDMGVSSDMGAPIGWRGGMISGLLVQSPGHHSVIDQALGQTPPPEPMLIADRSPAGLSPSARPSIDSIPNNHRAYAGQWFLFAAVAAIVYAIALRRRLRLGANKQH